jgi:predicted TPR repeat methyltransferase
MADDHTAGPVGDGPDAAPSDRPARETLTRVYGEVQSMTPAEVAVFYDEWATGYDRELVEGSGYAMPARAAAAFIAAGGRGPVLDAGCGTGLVGVALRRVGIGPVDGCDLSAGMLARASSTGAYRSLAAVDLTAGPLPADEGTYAGALCVAAIGFGHVPPEVVGELARVTATGGVIVVTVNDAYAGSGGLDAVVGRLVAAGTLELLGREHGDHLPGRGIGGWVWTMRRCR